MFNQKKVLSAVIAVGLLLSLGTPVSNAAPKNLARAVVQPDWLEQNLDDPKVRIIEEFMSVAILRMQLNLFGTLIS